MAISFTNDTATISTVEYSLPSDSTSRVAQTDDCVLEGFVDFGAMAAGDQYQIRMYEKVDAGTQRVISGCNWILTGVQSNPMFVIPSMMVGDGWDVTVLRLAGSDRTIGWSLRKTLPVITFTDDFATISTSEYSLPADTTSGVPTSQTADCILQLFLDLNALIAGDVFRLKVYEKTDSAQTQRLIHQWYFEGAQANPNYSSPVFVLGEGWDVTLIRVSGSDRSILWSLRKVG
jgi:hypothetical protein